MINISKITNTHEWKKLEPEWNKLLATSDAKWNPFLTFEWLYSWWEVFGEDKELAVLLAEDDTGLIAIAPLMVSKRTGFRVCEFIGTGRTDYLGFILSEINEGEVYNNFFKFINTNLSWHLMNLRDFIGDPENIILASKKANLKYCGIIGDTSPYLPLSTTWDEYLMSKSGKNRGNIKRAIKKIEADKEISVDCVRDYDPKLVDEIAVVEANSWKAETGSPRFSGNGRLFFDTIFNKFFKNQWLEIWTLRFRGKLLSHSINYIFNCSIYNYNIAYVKNYKEYVKHHSVGSILTSIPLRDSFERKHKVYDFLRGDEPYKKLWATHHNKLFYMAIYKNNLFSFLAYIIHFKLRLNLRENATAKILITWVKRSKKH